MSDANPSPSLMVVDDDAAVVDYLVESLGEEGFRVGGTTTAREALDVVLLGGVDLLIADLEMPEMRGLELLSAVLHERPDQLILLITAFGSIDLAAAAVRQGACDFVAKPFSLGTLVGKIHQALRERNSRRVVVRLARRISAEKPDRLVANSRAMLEVLALAQRVADTDSTVLISGESGVGKSALARFIHDHGRRRDGPLVQLNCASVPATLAETELFGVRRGAFTDAREDRPGLFVEADGGTLFLDEIVDLPIAIQAKLLDVLENGRVRPVGGGNERTVSVRIVTASNRPIEDAVRQGTFRQDLFHRLDVIRITVPPLRERIEDLPGLVDQLLARISTKLRRPVTGVSEAALRWLAAQTWPGNVRELANTLERAAVLAEHDVLLPEDVRGPARTEPEGDGFAAAAKQGLSLAEVENRYVAATLEAVGGNKSRAAKILGIDRRTLHRRLGESDGDEEDGR